MTFRKAQPDFCLALRSILPTDQQPITDQGLGVGVILGQRLFYQAHWVLGLRPDFQVGLRETTPPRFILKAQDPIGLCAGPPDQAIPCVFLRVYAGSGLVIQCLARVHFTPKRRRVARTVSPLISSAVRPCSKLTSAAKAKVHTLLTLPKVRGLWCSNCRNRSAPAAEKAAVIRWGRFERRCKTPSPDWLNAWMISRTVWSSQPTWRAIAGACSPRALANMTWQRRTTKPSEDRVPRFNVCCSVVLKARTKIGGRMSASIPHYRPTGLHLH